MKVVKNALGQETQSFRFMTCLKLIRLYSGLEMGNASLDLGLETYMGFSKQ